MKPKLPLLSSRQVIAALKRMGFEVVHRKGSHVKMQRSEGMVIVFPDHKEIDRWTLKGALKDAEIDEAEFLKNI
jgi:predicted RNA binding protein YcfA (HicA-like mRNA interferase family)